MDFLKLYFYVFYRVEGDLQGSEEDRELVQETSKPLQDTWQKGNNCDSAGYENPDIGIPTLQEEESSTKSTLVKESPPRYPQKTTINEEQLTTLKLRSRSSNNNTLGQPQQQNDITIHDQLQHEPLEQMENDTSQGSSGTPQIQTSPPQLSISAPHVTTSTPQVTKNTMQVTTSPLCVSKSTSQLPEVPTSKAHMSPSTPSTSTPARVSTSTPDMSTSTPQLPTSTPKVPTSTAETDRRTQILATERFQVLFIKLTYLFLWAYIRACGGVVITDDIVQNQYLIHCDLLYINLI